MAISTGTQLGPYRIVAPLGAGGMGEVYRARDLRLQREVAIKILASQSLGSAERRQRFLTEARAAGCLNHPNIVAVYDVGAQGETDYIVAELVEGESLRKEIQHGPLPVKKLLDVAVQVADGLAAAHQAGLVHRDLKPENIMVTRDGRAKILDFGLAKPAVFPSPDDDAVVDNLTGRITTGQVITGPGTILGTVPYMSPEQARGEVVDYRSDQFAFGLIVYEMATGRRALYRPTAVQTLSAIIDEEPDEIDRPDISPPLRWIIERCLSKDPVQRYAATIDLYHDLRQLRDHYTEAISARARPMPPRVRHRILMAALVAAGAVGCSVMGVLIGLALDVSQTPDLSVQRFTPLATEMGYEGSPAWSPDGKTVAYVAEVNGILQVLTRQVDSSTPAQLTQSSYDCKDPFWAPDGTRLYYTSLARHWDSLWSVGAAGGVPTVAIENATRAAISPDGATIAFFRQESRDGAPSSRLFIARSGGEPIPYETAPFDTMRALEGTLQFSRDGSKLAVSIVPAGRQTDRGTSQWWILPFPAGTPRQILSSIGATFGASPFSWMPDNRYLVIGLDVPAGGGPHLWLADTEDDMAWQLTSSVGSESSPTVAPDGARIAIAAGRSDYDLIEIDSNGAVRPLLATSRNEADPVWSRIGAAYAYVTDRSGTEEIRIKSQEGWERTLVTSKDFGNDEAATIRELAFSPEGRRIAYEREGRDAPRIWISIVTGGPPMPLTSAAQQPQRAPRWSPDGQTIAFLIGDGAEFSLAKMRVGAGQPEILKNNVMYPPGPQWSPNGEWISVGTDEGLALVAANGGPSRVIGDFGWLAQVWSGNGSTIYGIRQADDLRLHVVAVHVGRTRETIVADLGTAPLTNVPIRGFAVTPNNTFLTGMLRLRSDLWLLEGIRPPPRFSRWWPFGERP